MDRGSAKDTPARSGTAYLTLAADSALARLFSLHPKKLRTARTKETIPQMVKSEKGVVAPAATPKIPLRMKAIRETSGNTNAKALPIRNSKARTMPTAPP
jgi:hypothetical protein